MRIPRLRAAILRGIPSVAGDQLLEARKMAEDEFGISVLQMMENAGRNLADLAMAYMGAPRGKAAVVLAGGGFTGGGGMVAARHLINRGVAVGLALHVKAKNIPEETARQIHTLQKMEVATLLLAEEEIARLDFMESADVVLDTLVDYSLEGEPAGPVVAAIGAINRSYKRVLSLGAPSGLNPDTGEAGEHCVRARATLAVGLPTAGLFGEEARRLVGRVYLADIGIPREVYRAFDLEVGPVFASGSLVGL